jgi:hypothetical protein
MWFLSVPCNARTSLLTSISLSSSSYQLDVIFRPITLEEYDDYVEFTTEKGSFKVPIIARIAKLALDVPSLQDFGHCPVNEVVERTFIISNIGQMDAPFKLDFIEPFYMTPTSGVIPVGGKQVLMHHVHSLFITSPKLN